MTEKPRLCLILLLLSAAAFSGCASLVQSAKNQTCALDPAHPFDVVTVDLSTQELRLFWQDEAGQRYGSLDAVRDWAETHDYELVAATNAGIFEPGFVPTGLYVEAGEEKQPLNLDDGYGNFFLKPNGVFFFGPDGAGIQEATRFAAQRPEVAYATQSGPLLVEDGQIHPAFTEGSDNCRLRSGVGVADDGTVHLVISNGAVNFYDFATFFRDTLGSPNALYLDGGISRLYAPHLDRWDDGDFAAILAVLAPKEVP